MLLKFMSRFLPVCDGVISSSLDSAGKSLVNCSGGSGWISVDATYLPGQFDISMLDYVSLGYAFSAGYIIIASVLLVSKYIQIVLKAIRDF